MTVRANQVDTPERGRMLTMVAKQERGIHWDELRVVLYILASW